MSCDQDVALLHRSRQWQRAHAHLPRGNLAYLPTYRHGFRPENHEVVLREPGQDRSHSRRASPPVAARGNGRWRRWRGSGAACFFCRSGAMPKTSRPAPTELTEWFQEGGVSSGYRRSPKMRWIDDVSCFLNIKGVTRIQEVSGEASLWDDLRNDFIKGTWRVDG